MPGDPGRRLIRMKHCPGPGQDATSGGVDETPPSIVELESGGHRDQSGKISSPDPSRTPAHTARITLRQLLSMSAGFTDEQTGSRPANGKVASILKLPLQADRLAGS